MHVEIVPSHHARRDRAYTLAYWQGSRSRQANCQRDDLGTGRSDATTEPGQLHQHLHCTSDILLERQPGCQSDFQYDRNFDNRISERTISVYNNHLILVKARNLTAIHRLNHTIPHTIGQSTSYIVYIFVWYRRILIGIHVSTMLLTVVLTMNGRRS